MKLSDKELRLILAKPPGTLTADDLRWLRPDQIELLSPRHIGNLTTSLLNGMNIKQLGALTPDQMRVLTLEQMGLVPPSAKRRQIRLACHTANVAAGKASEADHALMLWQAWLALFFLLLLPFLRMLHKLNLI